MRWRRTIAREPCSARSWASTPARRSGRFTLGVLAQDPVLLCTSAREVPRPLASPERVMHGRDRELDLLRDEWRRSSEGRRIVVVRAPVGGGARRLAIALAEDVADQGSPVVHVDSAGQEPPGAMPDGPAPLVQDRVETASMPARGLVLRLAGPGAATEDADTVIDLAPLDAAAVRALVAEHVTGRDLDVVAAAVHAQSEDGRPGSAPPPGRTCGRRPGRRSAPPRTTPSRPSRTSGTLASGWRPGCSTSGVTQAPLPTTSTARGRA